MIAVRLMSEADIALGMSLKEQNRWNQTEADWRRFLALQPDGCFVAEVDGIPVGTVTTCVFGPVAWIAMMLVDAACRGRGIGKALMLHALEFLQGNGVCTIRLDATPLGKPLYEKLGFANQYTLHRYQTILPSPLSGEGPGVRATDCQIGSKGCQTHTLATFGNLSQLVDLDEKVTRTDRGKLLERLAVEFPDMLRVVTDRENVEGFIAARPGSRAIQVGPCIALNQEAGRLLLTEAFDRFAGKELYLDVPEKNTGAMKCAEMAGLQVQRSLLRMCRGLPVEEDVQSLWASSGPEMG
jgi:GNAT superfamily N-acetyltransferase